MSPFLDHLAGCSARTGGTSCPRGLRRCYAGYGLLHASNCQARGRPRPAFQSPGRTCRALVPHAAHHAGPSLEVVRLSGNWWIANRPHDANDKVQGQPKPLCKVQRVDSPNRRGRMQISAADLAFAGQKCNPLLHRQCNLMLHVAGLASRQALFVLRLERSALSVAIATSSS